MATDIDDGNYEYAVEYVRKSTRRPVGRSSEHFGTYSAAVRQALPSKDETFQVVRRRVGSWEAAAEGPRK